MDKKSYDNDSGARRRPALPAASSPFIVVVACANDPTRGYAYNTTRTTRATEETT